MSLFKRILLVFATLALVAAPVTVGAQTGDLFFGQEHSYSVIFRGNGEAVVFGKIIFTNTGDKNVSDFTLEVPDVKPSELMVLQQLSSDPNSPTCPPYYYPTGGLCMPESTDPYFGYRGGVTISPTIEYEKVTAETSGNSVKIKLAREIEPKNKGTLIIAYTATGYVHKSFGVFKYKFSTPKVDSRISKINVSVDVDSELILKGKRSGVGYATTGLIDTFAASSAKMEGMRMSEADFGGVVNMIGASGPVNKSAQNLSPNETLVVNGEYAQSKLALNLVKIIFGVLVFAVIILGVVLWIRRWKKNRLVAEASSGQVNEAVVSHKFQLIHPLHSSIGGGAAIVILGSIYLGHLVIELGMYGYGGMGYTMMYMPLVVILIVGLAILLALVLPPVLISSKYGWRAGVSVIINTFLAVLVLFAIFIALNVFGIWPETRPPQPYYY